MTRDIDRKLDNMEAERNYRENHEPLDTAEAEKKAEKERLEAEEAER